MSDEYFCPNCGDILNHQTGFNPSCGAWKCQKCGEMLVDDDTYSGDIYEGVAWFCDSCGELLNKQDGFSDSYGSWICTECGYNNSITEDDIIKDDSLAYTIGKAIGQGLTGAIEGHFTSKRSSYKNENDYENEDNYEDVENYIEPKETIKKSKEDTIRDVIMTCISFFCIIVCLMLSFFMIDWCLSPKKDEVKITINAKDYIGTNYEEVENKFKSMGFENIKCVPKEDLITGWINKEGETDKITINNDSKFKKDDIFNKNADVIIMYHSFKK